MIRLMVSEEEEHFLELPQLGFEEGVELGITRVAYIP